MCLVVYVASRSPLPLVPWQEDAPAFNVTDVTRHEELVRRVLSLPHVRQAGSHTRCGCGFNEGREHVEVYADPQADRAAALESSLRLARYVLEHHVQQIYSCWSGDEGEARSSERRLSADDLAAEDFFFRERELLTIEHDAA